MKFLDKLIVFIVYFINNIENIQMRFSCLKWLDSDVDFHYCSEHWIAFEYTIYFLTIFYKNSPFLLQ